MDTKIYDEISKTIAENFSLDKKDVKKIIDKVLENKYEDISFSKGENIDDKCKNVSIVQLARLLYFYPDDGMFLRKLGFKTYFEAQDALCKKIIDLSSTKEYKDLLKFHNNKEEMDNWIDGCLEEEYIECITGEENPSRNKENYKKILLAMFDGEKRSEEDLEEKNDQIENTKKEKDKYYITHNELQKRLEEHNKWLENDE